MRRLEGEWRQGRVLYVEALSPAGRAFGKAYGLRLTPSFALFDGQGRLVRVWTGTAGMPTRGELERLIQGAP
ncbi:hypothetical protein [Thermoflexus sp.]|uniref:hypothetical protein n=1 Tax=Thermoflexus sp. TaxID=1969742 RepID=UPI0025ED9D20|nr:hypothetical protein [Thermoflexus sp.]MDW8181726.1 hypothetical protein [Anaerolineae bacterium]MCS6964360.1 thioredoxin family protein [Thermoflexus sp.]MCS7352264.1 thioredoxin family protein [Thermoflexus sp.]MCX7689186.1 thioredoxin family protein [Thermoflexus sp.]MDW8185890.1 hypothetical protein [Anaerolineae bacterium]